MVRTHAEHPAPGLLGLELDPVAAPPSGRAAAAVPAKAPSPMVASGPSVWPMDPVSLPSVAAQGLEAVIQVHLDPDHHAWRSSVMLLADGGELLDHREDEGRIQLRVSPDPDDEGALDLPRDYDLLGLAVDMGLALLEGMDLPEGTRAILEASTHANATLSGRLRDWIKERYFEPGARPRFPYAHEAWGRVARKLWPAEGQPLAKVRWVY